MGGERSLRSVYSAGHHDRVEGRGCTDLQLWYLRGRYLVWSLYIFLVITAWDRGRCGALTFSPFVPSADFSPLALGIRSMASVLVPGARHHGTWVGWRKEPER